VGLLPEITRNYPKLSEITRDYPRLPEITRDYPRYGPRHALGAARFVPGVAQAAEARTRGGAAAVLCDTAAGSAPMLGGAAADLSQEGARLGSTRQQGSRAPARRRGRRAKRSTQFYCGCARELDALRDASWGRQPAVRPARRIVEAPASRAATSALRLRADNS